MMTVGGNALPDDVKAEVLATVKNFTSFTIENDPYGQHDFGSFSIRGHKCFWKIDYYGLSFLKTGSEDPADPYKTTRVLTIMLASEY